MNRGRDNAIIYVMHICLYLVHVHTSVLFGSDMLLYIYTDILVTPVVPLQHAQASV